MRSILLAMIFLKDNTLIEEEKGVSTLSSSGLLIQCAEPGAEEREDVECPVGVARESLKLYELPAAMVR